MSVAANDNALTTVVELRDFIADLRTNATTGRLDSDYLQTLINEASSFIARWCGCNLIAPEIAYGETDADVTYDLQGYGTDRIWLPDRPIISVTSVTFNVSQLTVPESTSVQTPGWYFTDEGAKAGRIELYGYHTDIDPRGVTVLAWCGYREGSVDETTVLGRNHRAALDTLKRACNTLCANWFENRLARSSQTIEGNTSSWDSGTMPSRVEELLRPFRYEEVL